MIICYSLCLSITLKIYLWRGSWCMIWHQNCNRHHTETHLMHQVCSHSMSAYEFYIHVPFCIYFSLYFQRSIDQGYSSEDLPREEQLFKFSHVGFCIYSTLDIQLDIQYRSYFPRCALSELLLSTDQLEPTGLGQWIRSICSSLEKNRTLFPTP